MLCQSAVLFGLQGKFGRRQGSTDVAAYHPCSTTKVQRGTDIELLNGVKRKKNETKWSFLSNEVARIEIVVEVVGVLFSYPCSNVRFIVTPRGHLFDFDMAK